ncbi:mitochondrial intermembrane space import and assembly protein 40-B isoform X1 [Cephus cinctus]|uniref:Mitochondrial intermembrane space import and assembly protein 40-B isoform X1 n=1 Tax=Cephus cinctus TaxID=211228 RepID=A0AAJ7BKG0_CEPCN|nr:mitochondrial intermembrane space import and assembly protein 40-B isoform X1 [Cephus cinctus]
MPLTKQEGKDTIIFASKEDHATPSKVDLPEPEPSPGLILPNGEINWNCPCLGGMATGPCGLEFREAFSCFHYSAAEPKGSDCYEAFRTMQACMSEYPALYGNKDTDLDDLDDENANAISNDKGKSSADETHKRKEVTMDTASTTTNNEDRPETSSSKKEVEQAKDK